MEWTMSYFVLAIASSLVLLWFQKRAFCGHTYPPGPRADPVIGHLRVIPQRSQEVVFREMSKRYGDLFYLHIPGRSLLVLNSLKTAIELLDQRSRIYNDRPKVPLLELMGWNNAFALMPFSKRYVKHRRLVNEHINQKESVKFWPLQTQYARRLVVRLTESCTDWMKYLDRFAAEVIVKVTYGQDIADNDPYLDICERALSSMTSCGTVGGTPVDFLPFLRYFPSWFPGTYYAFKARSFIPAVQQMYRYPMEGVQRQMREGTAQPSYITHHLEQLHGKDTDKEHIDDLQGTAVQMFAAGVETTASTIAYFVMAMVLFPDVQTKAQQEIDSVIGRSRLPELHDRDSLPYVRAVMYEVIRCYPVVPLGAPHRSTEDDVYNGMFIPERTVVIANSHAILRDGTIYKDPDTFDPSRYLPNQMETLNHILLATLDSVVGRICVGQYLADASLFIAIASILATLNIGREKDNNGSEMVPQVEYLSGLTRYENYSQLKEPLLSEQFPCVIKPRDKTSENLIRQIQIWDENR